MCECSVSCPRCDPVESLRPGQYRTLAFWGDWLGVHPKTVGRLFADEKRKVGGKWVIEKKHLMRRGYA